MAGTIEEKLTELVEPLIGSLGLSLWGMRFHGGHDHAVLQIYVDAEGGVNADQCGEVVDTLSPALDAADLIAPAYTLEVSSPGLDRILFTSEQFKQYVSKEIKVELKLPVLNRRKFTGVLMDAGDDGVFRLDDKDAGEVELAFANVATARVVPVFPQKGRKKGTGASA